MAQRAQGLAGVLKVRSKELAGKRLSVATLNVTTFAALGRRQEVEKWMQNKGIYILALQETKIATDSTEKNKSILGASVGRRGQRK